MDASDYGGVDAGFDAGAAAEGALGGGFAGGGFGPAAEGGFGYGGTEFDVPDVTFPDVSVIGTQGGIDAGVAGGGLGAVGGDQGGFLGQLSNMFGKKGVPALMSFLASKTLGVPSQLANLGIGLLSGKNPQDVGKGFAANVINGIPAAAATAAFGPLGGLMTTAAMNALGFGQAFANAPGAGQGMGPPGASVGNPGGAGPDMLSALMGLYNARQLSQMGRPTGVQSGANAQAQYLLGGGDISKMPGWQAGQQAITRSMASQGYLGSGNMMKALQDYGGDFYNKTLGTMAQLGQTQPGQYEATVGGMQLQGQALNRMLYDLARMSGTGNVGP